MQNIKAALKDRLAAALNAIAAEQGLADGVDVSLVVAETPPKPGDKAQEDDEEETEDAASEKAER